jgi:hypothetical protein
MQSSKMFQKVYFSEWRLNFTEWGLTVQKTTLPDFRHERIWEGPPQVLRQPVESQPASLVTFRLIYSSGVEYRVGIHAAPVLQ